MLFNDNLLQAGWLYIYRILNGFLFSWKLLLFFHIPQATSYKPYMGQERSFTCFTSACAYHATLAPTHPETANLKQYRISFNSQPGDPYIVVSDAYELSDAAQRHIPV